MKNIKAILCFILLLALCFTLSCCNSSGILGETYQDNNVIAEKMNNHEIPAINYVISDDKIVLFILQKTKIINSELVKKTVNGKSVYCLSIDFYEYTEKNGNPRNTFWNIVVDHFRTDQNNYIYFEKIISYSKYKITEY